MDDTDKTRRAVAGGGPFGGYFLGMVGTAVYYLQQVHTFWTVVIGLVKALVWPAFLSYHLARFLYM